MNGFINKLNLYEFFAMLIPGGLLLWVLIGTHFCNLQTSVCCCSHCTCEEQFIVIYGLSFRNTTVLVILSIIAIIASYVIGLVHHSIMNWWWTPLRNHPLHISVVYDTLRSNAQKLGINKYQDEFNCDAEGIGGLLLCPCAFLRILYMILCNILYPCTCLCKKLCCCQVFIRTKIDVAKGNVLDEYYTRYYKLARMYPNTSCHSIERQIVFCRNLIYPLLIMCDKAECLWILPHKCFLLLIAIALMVYCVVEQEKVYRIVFEDYEYTRDF